MSQFKRGIRKPGMMEALAELAARESWWADVLKDKTLIIGVRDDYLNVYWRGQSLFKVEMNNGRVVATTHPKYLLDPDLSGQVVLDGNTGAFALDGLDALTRNYRPGETLNKLKRAANLFTKEEKEGVQAIVNANANVVDVEVAFPAVAGSRNVPRIDIATFSEDGEAVRLVFWEAKVLANPELRPSGDKNVVTQINAYADLLAQHAQGVLESYKVISRNLVAFALMSNGARTLAPAIQNVADGADLTLATPADVRLVVFGFDAAQRDLIWKPLLAPLEERLGTGRILARGEPSGIRL